MKTGVKREWRRVEKQVTPEQENPTPTPIIVRTDLEGFILVSRRDTTRQNTPSTTQPIIQHETVFQILADEFRGSIQTLDTTGPIPYN